MAMSSNPLREIVIKKELVNNFKFCISIELNEKYPVILCPDLTLLYSVGTRGSHT